ncbi:hypothetical protein DEU56DRAFT_815362 [Suillus clintonianus]|uniref:uncharacterized protein n=1 Tax=Suillus clintonianus TaxID=1904413 RepID=UPI001B87CC71|nr:uncharacterized protein DEU56DRAFT_815362 [Suillus clintonianus]KAG2130751.1 hypothetical protein DEU56DRAFT_815362 [Suillus clintonianus]
MPHTFHHDHAHPTLQGNTHKGLAHDCHRHHVHNHGCQPAMHIVVPTIPASRTIIHSRYSESDPLLRTGRRRNDGPGCCFFTILGAVLILGVFAIVFFSFMPLNEIAWTNIESHSCTTYGTKEYVAELNASPWKSHRMEICKATPVFVHGRPHWPSRCEDRSGTVIGHFAINHDEPDCVTYWSGYRDMGCSAKGSRKRHIVQRLENLPFLADYKEFCATTPAQFLDRKFSGAESCESSIWGVYGQWFIDDHTC